MAEETIYSPGKKSYRTVAMSDIMKNFPELTTEGHFDFNDFLAEHPELQDRSYIYNVLGVLGVSSFFGKFAIPPLIASFDLYFMTAVIIFITLFMFGLKKITRLYGISSLVMYVGYISYLYI